MRTTTTSIWNFESPPVLRRGLGGPIRAPEPPGAFYGAEQRCASECRARGVLGWYLGIFRDERRPRQRRRRLGWYLAATSVPALARASGRGAGRGRGPVAVRPGRLRRSRGCVVRRRRRRRFGRRRRRRRRRRFGRNEGRRCRRHTIVILSRLLQRDLGVREELARRLQHRGVHRDAGLVLGVRLDERVEDGPLLLEPVLPAWTPIA